MMKYFQGAQILGYMANLKIKGNSKYGYTRKGLETY